MKGSVGKRCPCPIEYGAGGKRLACRKDHGSWSFVVDLGSVREFGPDLPPEGRIKRRQVTRGGYRTKAEAEAALAEVADAAAKGSTVAVDSSTVAEYLRGWLRDRVTDGLLRPTTAASYRQHVESHWVPRIGHLRLRDLRPAHVEVALREIGATQGVGPSTVRRSHATLRSALSSAVRRRLLPYNPAVNVDLPTASRPKVTPWEPADLGAFLDHVGSDPLGPVFEVLAMTGLRRGEVLGLRWQDVDTKRARLVVRQQVVTVRPEYVTPCRVCGGRHGDHLIAKPKTSSGEARIVDLDDHTVATLLLHRLSQDADRDAWGDGYNDHGLVFAQPDGTPIPPDRLTKRFPELLAEVRFPDDEGKPDAERRRLPRIRLHDLRHGQASLMLKAGVPIAVVSKRLGHSTIGLTADTYSHLLDGVGRDAAQRASDQVPRARTTESVSNL